MSNLFREELKDDPKAQQRVREWIAALRSGTYEQGLHMLRANEGGFCCLGVACDLFAGQVRGRWSKEEGDYAFTVPVSAIDDARHVAYLPNAITNLLHLTSGAGAYRGGAYLSADNDDGKSFAEIADIIEHELREALA